MGTAQEVNDLLVQPYLVRLWNRRDVQHLFPL